MKDIQQWKDLLLPLVGEMVLDKIEKELETLLKDKTGWQRTVLELIQDAVAKHGPAGVKISIQIIEDLLNKKKPDLNWADLRVASDILAELQNAEADKQTKVKEFLAKVSKVVALIIEALIKGFLA